MPRVILLMGVAGSGKTTIGETLAQETGWPFRDADSFHPQSNIDKMRRGEALTDADRWPWLDAIAAWIDERRQAKQNGIVSSSALKRVYRERLQVHRPDVQLVYLKGDRALIGARMAAREGHFMPNALLDSQFQTLEEPVLDERALVVSVDATAQQIVNVILADIAGSD